MATHPPWKCAPCKRMVKGKDLHCPGCGYHWTSCADQSHGESKESWQSETSYQQGSSRRRRRTRSQSAHRKATEESVSQKKGKGKGTGKGKEKGGEIPSGYVPPTPFSNYQNQASSLTPWISEALNSGSGDNSTPQVAAPGTSSSASASNELVAALVRAYPDRDQMPKDVRELIDRTNSMTARSITKDLHAETSNLGKAKKMLQEITEAKRAHKQAWTQHLLESVELWKKQLQDYTQQQASLAEKENKAIRDIQSANKAIQALNLQAAEGEKATPTPTELVPTTSVEAQIRKDKETADLQKQLQKAFQDCMEVSGLKINKDIEEVLDSDGEDGNRKRPRSTEPPPNTTPPDASM